MKQSYWSNGIKSPYVFYDCSTSFYVGWDVIVKIIKAFLAGNVADHKLAIYDTWLFFFFFLFPTMFIQNFQPETNHCLCRVGP